MSSTGLKRPLELELAPHMGNPSGSNIPTNNQQHNLSTTGSNANGSKRRCTNYVAQSRADNPGYSSSTFKDPSSLLTPLSEDVATMIKDEIHKSHDNTNQRNTIEPPVLTVRQTQKICERLIKEREQRLRDEYDKILISKLAEQYDTFVRYTHDHIEKRYNESNLYQASYLS